MNKQIKFSELTDELLQARTSKKEFLEKIERIIPWKNWIEIIRSCYYKREHGNKPYDIELMLRIFNPSDMCAMTEVIDVVHFLIFAE